MGKFPKLFGIGALLVSAFLAGADIVYDFSKTTPQNRSFVTGWASGIAERRIEDGALAGNAKKAPAYFLPVKVGRRLSEVQLLTVEIKAGPDAGKIQIFANLGDPSQSYLEQKLTCDGEFHTYSFDLGEMSKVKKAGVLKNFRLNPVTAPAEFAIRSIKLAPGNSGGDVVYDFKSETPKNRHFLREWAQQITDRRVEDGVLKGTARKAPAYFLPVKVDRPLAEVQLLTVEMKASPDAGKIQIFANLGDPSQSYLEQKLICDGEFHTYCFDFGGMAKVKNAGVLKKFRLNPVTAPADFAIRSIRLAPLRRHLPGVEAVVPKAPAQLNVPNFFQVQRGGLAAAATKLAINYTDSELVIAFESALSNVDYKAAATVKDGRVYNDDCFDINISPGPDSYYQIVFNPTGTVFDQHVTYEAFLKEGQKKNDFLGFSDPAWDSGATIRSDVAPGKWSGSIAIPFRSLGLDKVPEALYINIARCSVADGKGVGVWNYSPVLRFAVPENLRKVTLGKQPSATVIAPRTGAFLPGRNTVTFGNPDRRKLECRVTARDWKTGSETVFANTADSAEVSVDADLGESRYELLLTAHEDGRMIFFDVRETDTSTFRPKFAAARRAVRSWPNDGKFAAVKAEYEAKGAKLEAAKPLDFAAVRDYVAAVEKLHVELYKQGLLRATRKNFDRQDLPFAVAAASSADKNFHTLSAEAPPFAGKAASALTIETAANEVEGIQLVLVNPDRPVTDLKIRLAEKPAGKAPEITLKSVEFLDTSTGRETPYKVSYRGEWPEVLAHDLPQKLAPGEVRSIWINAETAADVPAGEYRYTVEVSAAGVGPALTIPLTVRVWDFALPVVPSLRTAVSSFEGFVHGYYQAVMDRKLTAEEKAAINDRLARFMLKHRMNPGYIYTMRCFNKQLLEYPDLNRLEEYRKLGLNAVPIGQLPMGGYGNTAEDMVKRFYSDAQVARLVESLRESYDMAQKQGVDPGFYLHCFDEVYAATHKKEKIAVFRTLAERIRKEVPNVKFECITYVEPELVGIVDIWCPSIAMMTKDPEPFRKRQQAGDELWLYTCLGQPGHVPGQPPSFVLEESAAAMRLIGWICRFYRAEGFLYYATVRWRGNTRKGAAPYPETPWNFQNTRGYNGENTLIYPARHFTQEPLSSIRLENLRDGFEDFEYFKMLEEGLARNRAGLSAAEVQEIEELLAMKEIVRGGWDYSDDSGKILNHRRKMAQWIERLRKTGK